MWKMQTDSKIKDEKKSLIIEVHGDLIKILEEIKKGWKEATGLNLSWREASFIFAQKWKKADLSFIFP